MDLRGCDCRSRARSLVAVDRDHGRDPLRARAGPHLVAQSGSACTPRHCPGRGRVAFWVAGVARDSGASIGGDGWRTPARRRWIPCGCGAGCRHGLRRTRCRRIGSAGIREPVVVVAAGPSANRSPIQPADALARRAGNVCTARIQNSQRRRAGSHLCARPAAADGRDPAVFSVRAVSRVRSLWRAPGCVHVPARPQVFQRRRGSRRCCDDGNVPDGSLHGADADGGSAFGDILARCTGRCRSVAGHTCAGGGRADRYRSGDPAESRGACRVPLAALRDSLQSRSSDGAADVAVRRRSAPVRGARRLGQQSPLRFALRVRLRSAGAWVCHRKRRPQSCELSALVAAESGRAGLHLRAGGDQATSPRTNGKPSC